MLNVYYFPPFINIPAITSASSLTLKNVFNFFRRFKKLCLSKKISLINFIFVLSLPGCDHYHISVSSY